jgi:23S rRNA pseudouridine2605 synthase
MEERLHKFLSNAGVASRRKCEELISNGKVKVNGSVVTELGTKIDSESDKIEYDGKIIKVSNEKVYVLLNKPIGYVTTVKDQFLRDTVMDLVKTKQRLVPVGRLDMYTSGALILSNDGEFINKITHPSNEIEKTYNATVAGQIANEDIEKIREGVEIDDNGTPYKTREAKVKILKIDEEKNLSRIQIVIHEGKNREVRKMCESIGKRVLALHRAKIGNIDVKDLPLGKWRYLTKNEVERLVNGSK